MGPAVSDNGYTRRGFGAQARHCALQSSFSSVRWSSMMLGKLVAVLGAAALLGALVSSASARNFSTSEQRNTALWRAMNFVGGFGGFKCEVKFSGSLHTRTSTKTVNFLIGYITEGTVLRCARAAPSSTRKLSVARRYRESERIRAKRIRARRSPAPNRRYRNPLLKSEKPHQRYGPTPFPAEPLLILNSAVKARALTPLGLTIQ
jgi:hypothetical protein